MAKHLQRELENLKKDLLFVGALVEEAVEKSILTLADLRQDLAQQVIAGDEKINEKEVEIEESCLKILALHQPVAEDLRFVAAVIRINNDLERMGDYAASIAERAQHFMRAPITVPSGIQEMERLAKQMLKDSLDAFVKHDAELARKVCVTDEQMDTIHDQTMAEIRQHMKTHPKDIDSALDLFTTARRLERIADMSTNICQDVVYMVEGEIIRHRPDQYPW